MRVSRLLSVLFVALGALALTPSCSPSGFQDPSSINSVRILASSADQPYAKPGATVNLTVLAYDGRTNPPEPMKIYWLPFVCKDPPDDAYYACFAQIAAGAFGGGTAGGDAGSGAPSGALGPHTDLTPFLQQGPQFRFTMPSDAITSHAATPGTTPYGLAVVFNVACAGHLELLPIDPNDSNPQALPIGCFDASEEQLGPSDYVFGFTRVYAYEALTDANPVIDHVDVNGQTYPVMPAPDGQLTTMPVPMSSCTNGCPIGPVVPASSQEPNPLETDVNGNPGREEIWVDYYTTVGSVNDTALLYDPTTGLVGDPSTTDGKFAPPTPPASGTFWAVVHDDRGGTSWVTVPLSVP